MQYMSKLALNPIVKRVIRYFDFLIDRGFEVSNTSSFFESFGNWFVEFESPDCFLIIFSDRDEVLVSMYPIKTDRNIVTDLGFMVYFLSNGQVIISPEKGNLVGGAKKQLERSARLLEEYIDRIVPYFGQGYEKNKEELMAATKKFDAIQLERYGLQTLKGKVKGL
jgi:hypothetical protein